MAINFVRVASSNTPKGSSVSYRNPGDVDHVISKRAEFTKASSTGLSYVRSGVRQANKLARIGKKGTIVPADVVVNITVTAPAGLNEGENAYVLSLIEKTTALYIAEAKAAASIVSGFVADAGSLSVDVPTLAGSTGTTAKQYDGAMANASIIK